MTKQSTLNVGTLGAISALVATFCFSLNDSSIKFLSGGYALHQIVLVRSVLALIFLLLVIVPFDGGFGVLKTKRLGMHLMRGFCVVFANMTFFLGLSVLPLADTVAVFFISPLIITALSVLVLGEQVGPRRWIAVGAGLLGVLIMVRPGSGDFQVALMLPFVSAFAYASLHILTRKIGATESAATMSVYIQITFIVVSGVIGLMLGHGQYAGQGGPMLEFLLRGWVWPAQSDLWILFLLGFSSALGGFFISQAYRLAEASVIAPLEYTAMPMAIVFGVVIFGEWPEPASWLGMSLIIGAGLFIFWRESRVGRPKGVARPRTRR
ncbi:PEP-CTERM protein-sorting domain-containing protein [Shimia gijangensis]|uniref:PEP-CTERM protein-sorting domain-containing protein n=1 Tax=Shimia gijangensis TaxID=1470563 RepID=A0A1M6JIA0_9RHOB|nr:DMT family transporter [Shimia gijangensis]SHJ46414.1 PEP-CTERM protein-sorting domain-containing protein [Shimia gijangensis]